MAWQRMTDDEIVDFARGFVAGEVFTSFHIHPDDQERLVPQVFLPLALGGFEVLTEQDKEDIGALWAPMQSATVTEVEGYPTFAEVKVMHILDWKLASRLIHRLQGEG